MMTGGRRIHLPALAALLLLGGCVGGAYETLTSGSESNLRPAANTASLLAAADGEEDEFGALLMKPPPEAAEKGAAEAASPEEPPERAGRYGVRCGVLITVAAEEGPWSPTVCAGVYYRGAQLASKRMVYELGLDYVPLEREDGYVSSGLVLLRGEVLFGSWSAEDRGTSFYLLGGADLISENGTREATAEAESAIAAGINLGLGVGSTRGVWDARVVCSLFPGSANVKGNILVAAGVSF